jgi:hypothetical protein
VALLSRFLGGTVTEGAAFAFGAATAPVLAPGIETIRQAAWELHAVRIPEAAELAAAVARGKVDRGTAAGWAKKHGFDGGVFDTLVTIAELAPDVGTAMRAWRRGKLTTTQFETVLKRSGLADEWVEAIEALKAEILDPGQLAAAIHRGLIPDPGILLGEQPSGPRKVASYPVQPIDALEEAAGSGYDKERLAVLVGLQGLPMGTHEAAEAYFRGIIEHGDYIAAFNESNSRNEWAEAVLEYTRQIPTARDFFENALRGYHDLAWAQQQAQRHGMTPEDSLVIYQNQGRPMNVHAITQALARGGKFQPEPGELTDPYEAAIVEGNLKPAYYDLAKANRYTLPSYFVLKAIHASGGITTAQAAQLFKETGWPPDLADKAAAALDGGATAAKTNPLVGKAETQLWTALHKAYVKTGVPRATLEPQFAELEPDAAVRDAVYKLWDAERIVQHDAPPAP